MPKNQSMSSDKFLKALKDFELKDKDDEGGAMSLKQYIDSLTKKDVASKKHGGSIKIR